MIKKWYNIALKPVNEIRYIRQIKIYYFSLVLDILCVAYFLTSITMPDHKLAICIRYGK